MEVELKPRIVVFGVGGAGGNAVNNMIESKLVGVEFVVANTDAQALERSCAEEKIQLGLETTEGLGAGARPDVGAASAEESLPDIQKHLKSTHMCFIAAGMGGGTGTGAAPIIAREAGALDVLTVGVVTKPFDFEGRRRKAVAEQGIEDLRRQVDTLVIIPNQNLFRVANANTTFADAFGMADRVLYSAVRGITDLMVMPGLINLDFADVRTVMAEMGSAMMGTGEADGENRAVKSAQAAIANPLLDDVSMRGARGVLINITGGQDMTLFEVDEAANEIKSEVDANAQIILGSTFDNEMDGRMRVSVVATGIEEAEKIEPRTPVIGRRRWSSQQSEDSRRAEHRPEIVFEEESLITPDMSVELDPEQPATRPEKQEPAPDKFSSLFGLRKPLRVKTPRVKTRPDFSERDGVFRTRENQQDDDELEIPAFLRRSGNT